MQRELEEELRALRATRDKDINLDDIAEVTDRSNASRRHFYRSRKKAISLRLDLDVLEWLKSQPGPYTARINEACRSEIIDRMIPDASSTEGVLEALLLVPAGRLIAP